MATAGSFAPVASSAPSAPSSSGTAFLSKAAAAAATPAVHLHRQVNIEIKRDGDRISLIRIQCRCGELIELDCEY